MVDVKIIVTGVLAFVGAALAISYITAGSTVPLGGISDGSYYLEATPTTGENKTLRLGSLRVADGTGTGGTDYKVTFTVTEELGDGITKITEFDGVGTAYVFVAHPGFTQLEDLQNDPEFDPLAAHLTQCASVKFPDGSNGGNPILGAHEVTYKNGEPSTIGPYTVRLFEVASASDPGSISGIASGDENHTPVMCTALKDESSRRRLAELGDEQERRQLQVTGCADPANNRYCIPQNPWVRNDCEWYQAMQFTMNPYTESTFRAANTPVPWFGTGATTALTGCEATFVDCSDMDGDGNMTAADCDAVENGGQEGGWLSSIYGGNNDDGMKVFSMDEAVTCTGGDLLAESGTTAAFSSAGSNDVLDWIENANFIGLGMGGMMKDYGTLGKKTTHGGFYKQGMQNFKLVEDKFADAKKVLVAGHSLGGAAANVVSRHLEGKGYKVLTITAGEPPAFFDASFGAGNADAHHRIVTAVDGISILDAYDPVSKISEVMGCKHRTASTIHYATKVINQVTICFGWCHTVGAPNTWEDRSTFPTWNLIGALAGALLHADITGTLDGSGRTQNDPDYNPYMEHTARAMCDNDVPFPTL